MGAQHAGRRDPIQRQVALGKRRKGILPDGKKQARGKRSRYLRLFCTIFDRARRAGQAHKEAEGARAAGIGIEGLKEGDKNKCLLLLLLLLFSLSVTLDGKKKKKKKWKKKSLTRFALISQRKKKVTIMPLAATMRTRSAPSTARQPRGSETQRKVAAAAAPATQVRQTKSRKKKGVERKRRRQADNDDELTTRDQTPSRLPSSTFAIGVSSGL